MNILVAMSGGVDSSVAAKLLADAGTCCTGCTMKLYTNEDAGIPRGHTCCSLDDVEDARMVAEGIEEHRAADAKVIPDLHKTDPSTIEYSGRLKVLKDYIFHHLKEEEEDMFPKVRELIGRKELRELGEKMMARKKELLGEVA